jgi:hypothetical protein
MERQSNNAGNIVSSGETTQTSKDSAGEQQLNVQPSIIALPTGEELSLEDSYRLTARALARVIVIAGDVDSGKTTLIASMYDQFNYGTFAEYAFAGSETLAGWERRCFLSRIESGRGEPETVRTPGTDCLLLHLRLRSPEPKNASQDMLLTDVSGEAFRLIRDSTEECRQFVILKRADHFAVAIDGGKLADPRQRQEVLHSALQIVRSCIDAEMLTTRSYINVLFTKYDLLKPHLEEAGVKEFLTHVVDEFRRRFENRVSRLRFFDVAARPSSGALPKAYGLEALIRCWVEDSPFQAQIRHFKPSQNSFLTQFDRFLMKDRPDDVS